MYTDIEREQMAIFAIKKYLNVLNKAKWTDEYLKTNYPLAIKRLVENSKAIDDFKMVGISQMSQGSQSVSFGEGIEAFLISKDVAMLLPNPYLKTHR